MSSIGFLKGLFKGIGRFLLVPVFFGRFPGTFSGTGVVLFPCRATLFCCGLAGFVSYKKRKEDAGKIETKQIPFLMEKALKSNFATLVKNPQAMETGYLGGDEVIDALSGTAQSLKTDSAFYATYLNEKFQEELRVHYRLLDNFIQDETRIMSEQMGAVDAGLVRTMVRRLETLKDISWCLKSELLENIAKVRDLQSHFPMEPAMARILIFKKINSVLNSIDRLEVRGRDSAGISMMFWIDPSDFEQFEAGLSGPDHEHSFSAYKNRRADETLLNQCIRIHDLTTPSGEALTAVALVYKFASEIGRLGDNVAFLREQIRSDPILQMLTTFPMRYDLISAHTRWASVGAINESNCHPMDNRGSEKNNRSCGNIIHVCLNGDIDNYLELKRQLEKSGRLIHQDITTDTKIIPLLIERNICNGDDVLEAFRKAVCLFEGSHAILMHTDMEPGKLFLAQKGSGQALFIGVADDYYLTASEVYGFVEETSLYWKMGGEKVVDGISGKTQGQIVVLDQNSEGGISGIKACYYDKTPVLLTDTDIRKTGITSRDIDRQGFAHYFLKEISEAPASVEKTLENRWKTRIDGMNRYGIELDEGTVPLRIQHALKAHEIRRIFFVGQGTAGVAAQVCANLFNYYLNGPEFPVAASKASEFSGFMISDSDDHKTFQDALVIAVSQSGTTADTNRTIDMVKKRGAYTLAIVNRRDSDITYKVDGVMYTSSGRDIEMSVASTKAFYSQIVAGALLGLFVATKMGVRNEAFIAGEIKSLLAIPEKMRKVLSGLEVIRESANRTASTKMHWAVVGSGPNKASADEIRIKLSELCYKTISTDYVEDKKHIDLSSEPLIIVCTAGTRPRVVSDIVKDCAIFQAHKAVPIVIADEGEHRFDRYAVDVLHVPPAPEHLSPILNTLAGHLWGYCAALAIHEGSAVLYRFREDLRRFIDEQSEKGLDVYEIILDKAFREKVAGFYYALRKQKAQNRLPVVMAPDTASDLTLLLKYLSGRLPVSDFELDFGKKGTAMNMLNALFECMGNLINCMSRPVDAIKHQAKTVTVGTSRISEKVTGLLFDVLESHEIGVSRLTNNNVIVLKNLQDVIETVNGTILYKIDDLDLLGEPTDHTTITVLKKTGLLETIPSRVESDTSLKGTKRIIVRQGNVYIGKGRKDDRSILVIPVISTDPDLASRIEHLLLFNISFKDTVPIRTKVKALGGKYEHIKNIVQENSLKWEDEYLNLPEIGDLFGRSAEKIAEFIASRH